jgi:hypothetical protein
MRGGETAITDVRVDEEGGDDGARCREVLS